MILVWSHEVLKVGYRIAPQETRLPEFIRKDVFLGDVTEFTDGVRNRSPATSFATSTSIVPRDGDPHTNFRIV